jgi:hypothetical protein
MRYIVDRVLLKSQRADVFRVIEASGFDPVEFHWDTVESMYGDEVMVPRLTHRPTGFEYTFEQGMSLFAPGEQEQQQSLTAPNWPNHVVNLNQWLGFAQREMDAPSLWEDLALGEPMLNVPMLAEAQDTPFSGAEAAAIRGSIAEAVQYLKNELPPGSIAFLEARLLILDESIESTGRVTWMQLAVGLAMTAVWGGLMAPDQARHMLDIIGKAFQHLLGAG